MIFIDTSAIVAILLGESDASHLSETAQSGEQCLTSAAVRLEACMTLATRRDVSPSRAQNYFDALASEMGLREIPIDEEIGRAAVVCFERYCKGPHPARLNFGDCLAYACAKSRGASLLFKGDDFSQTDIEASRRG